jgi:hypothetical protein
MESTCSAPVRDRTTDSTRMHHGRTMHLCNATLKTLPADRRIAALQSVAWGAAESSGLTQENRSPRPGERGRNLADEEYPLPHTCRRLNRDCIHDL